MNNFEIRFNNILKKYFFLKGEFKETDTKGMIGNIIQENNKGNFAIWGAGEHTQVLYNEFSAELKNCMFIIDNNKQLLDTDFLGFKIVTPGKICNLNIDTIFISSYNGRVDIKKQVERLLPKCKVIDFYDILEKKYNIQLREPFYLEDNIYKYIFKLNKSYKLEKNIQEKQVVLEKLIYSYLKINDFYNAEKLINFYIEKRYIKKQSFINLLKELDELFFDLNKTLTQRKGNDIILLFFDSLRAKDVYKCNSSMKFLNNLLNKSKYFTNAFSPSIFTYESITAIFNGNLPFYNELYKRKTINQNEVDFIQEAIKNGYNIKIYSLEYWHIISGKDIHRGKYNPIMSQNIWNALCDLAENKNEKTIYLLYFLQETHPPHLCGYHTVQPIEHNTPFTCNDNIKQSQEQFNIQYRDCLKYVDKQLKYYFNIMGDDITKVIFSDHGQIVEEAMSDLKDVGTLAGWHDDRYHIPLILSGNKIKPSKCDTIFSMVNFNDLIIKLIYNTEYVNNQKYIEVNFSPIFNKTIKKKYTNAEYDDYLYGFRVLRDDKFKLIITGSGKYKVYVLPEQFKECTEKNIKKMVMDKFSKLVDVSIPEFK